MVELCREKFVAFAARALPLMLLGDLNFNPADSNYALLIGDGWRDSYEVASAPDSATFLYDMPDIPGGRIDHILYRGDGLTPRTWSRLLSPDPKRRVSDHDPVYVRFSLE
jgi:endonuclease/exonuclease/phosphatase family metal-dependent hydrolase